MTSSRAATVAEVCDECGVEFDRPPGRRKHRCFDCRLRRSIEVTEQMRYGAGPVYEKVVRKQAAYWRAEAKRLGIRA